MKGKKYEAVPSSLSHVYSNRQRETNEQAKTVRKLLEKTKEEKIPLQRDMTLIGNLLEIERPDSVPPQIYAVISEIFLLLEKAEKEYESENEIR